VNSAYNFTLGSLVTQRKKYSVANDHCLATGMVLATIRSSEENDEVRAAAVGEDILIGLAYNSLRQEVR
jgi:hypothetical protein